MTCLIPCDLWCSLVVSSSVLIVSFFIGIWEYIEGVREVVTDLDERVLKAQRNAEVIKGMLKKFEDQPLFTRFDDGRPENLFNGTGSTSKNIIERAGILNN